MNIRFYKGFSKRKNSTKIPAMSDTYDEIDCKLKEDCSIEAPSFIISQRMASASGNPVTVSTRGGSMVSPVVTFNIVQEGTGEPSALNPRPFTFYNNLNVNVNGNDNILNLDTTVAAGVTDFATGQTILKYKYITITDVSQLRGFVASAAYGGYAFINGYYSKTSMPNTVIAQGDKCLGITYNQRITDYNDRNRVYVDPTGQIAVRSSNTETVNNIQDLFAIFEGITICFAVPDETIATPTIDIPLYTGLNTITVNGNSTIAFSYRQEKIDLTYTYVYVPEFNRYYFISNAIILSNNRVEYSCECDTLASFKSNVGSTVAHIAYAATGYDKFLIDSRLPVKTTKNINTQVDASGLSNSGMYVAAIINDRSATKLGACTFYIMTEANMNNLAYNLSDQSIITDLRNIFNNPLDSIVKVIWIPLAPGSVPQTHYDNAELIYAGSRALNLAGHECYGAPIKDFVVELDAVSLLIPDKQQDFRDVAPFTTGSLYLPGLGLTDLNMSDFVESLNVNIKTYIDITTGDITYRMYNDDGQVLKTCIFNGSTEIPLAHVTNNAGGTLASIGGVAGGAITAAIAGAAGNLPVAFGGMATALASGASAVMQTAMRATSIKGGISGRSGFYDTTFKLLIVQLETADPDDANYIAMFGRPVGVTHAISNHSGFVQCENASVSIAGTSLERDRINDYLNTGFFYE